VLTFFNNRLGGSFMVDVVQNAANAAHDQEQSDGAR